MKNAILKFAARRLCQMPAPIVRLLSGKPITVDGQTLDPVVQMMVRHFTDPPGKIGTVQELRTNFDVQSQWLCHPPAPGVRLQTLAVEGPNGPVPCEIHRPEDLPSRDAPALMFYHGGGHVGGSLTSHRGVCRQLAHDVNCAVVAVDYRLAPEHKFPSGIHDSLAAYDAIVGKADELGFDPGRVAIGGDSAGGNVTAVVAQQRKDAPHAPKYQILWSPWLDMSRQRPSYERFALGYFLEKPTMEWYTDHYLPDAESGLDPMASPMLGDVTGVCPAAVMVAGFDPLRDDGLDYARKLEAAGVPTKLNLYEGVVHPFVNVAGYVPVAREAFKDAVSLIRANL